MEEQQETPPLPHDSSALPPQHQSPQTPPNPLSTTTAAADAVSAADVASSTIGSTPFVPSEAPDTILQRPTLPNPSPPRPQPPYQHFSQHPPMLGPSPQAAAAAATAMIPVSSPSPRGPGGVAIGVPAHHRPPSMLAPRGPSFGSQGFGHQVTGFGRNPGDQVARPGNKPRQGLIGMHTIGVMGSLSTPPMRPSFPVQSPRPAQQPVRSASPSTSQAPVSQRLPGVSSPRVLPSGMQQISQSHPQQWLSPQGRPPATSLLASASYRPQFNTQNMQKKSVHNQQPAQSSLPGAVLQHQFSPPLQQQLAPMPRGSEYFDQQQSLLRAHYPVLHQKLAAHGSFPVQPLSTPENVEAEDTSDHVLSRRTIQELVSLVDPDENLEIEVEDILMEIADDFVDSVITSACSLAKQRKSKVVEPKDILPFLERYHHMNIPGFSGDDLKSFRKPTVTDAHKQRLSAALKSAGSASAVADAGNVKGSSGQGSGNLKSHHIGRGPPPPTQ